MQDFDAALRVMFSHCLRHGNEMMSSEVSEIPTDQQTGFFPGEVSWQ